MRIRMREEKKIIKQCFEKFKALWIIFNNSPSYVTLKH